MWCYKFTVLIIPFCRVGLTHKDKLSYEHFLKTFEDPRHSVNGGITLDSPLGVPRQVSFETAEDLQVDQVIVRLRKKVSDNAESIRNVIKDITCFYGGVGNLLLNKFYNVCRPNFRGGGGTKVSEGEQTTSGGGAAPVKRKPEIDNF